MSYSILTLDGGGSWALLQAAALGALHGADTPGHTVLKHYSFVAANSGGSLVLAALLEDLTPAQIMALFRDEPRRRAIFREKGAAFVTRWLGIGPRYRAAAKLDGLHAVLPHAGPRLLSELGGVDGLPHLLIVGYDYDRNRAAFFRSYADSRATNTHRDITLAEAAHASSNAPLNYFDKPALVTFGGKPRRMWDGAIGGYNNPSLAAVVEAVANGTPVADIALLSIGTGTTFLPIDDNNDPVAPGLPRSLVFEDVSDTGFKDDILRMSTTILGDPPDAATYIAYVWLGAQSQTAPPVVRLSPMIRPVWDDAKGFWRLPESLNADEFRRLRDLDMDAVPQADVERIVKLGELWLADAVPNQPIRSGARLTCDLGHPTFSEGVKAWRNIADKKSSDNQNIQPIT